MRSRTSARGSGRELELPGSRRDIDAAAHRARKIVTRRALLSAGAAVVPIPGFDLAVDVSQLLRMIEDINACFGLSPLQIERLSTRRRVDANQAMATVGSALVGRLLTRELVLQVLRRVGLQLTAQQAARYVPIAGQALAATLSFVALRWLGEQHIRDCERVAALVIDLNPSDDARR